MIMSVIVKWVLQNLSSNYNITESYMILISHQYLTPNSQKYNTSKKRVYENYN